MTAKIVRLTQKQLRKIIKEELTRTIVESTSDEPEHITPDLVVKLAPQTLKNIGQQYQPDSDDLKYMWIMRSKPELLQAGNEDDPNVSDYEDEVWSQTNEPELGAWLNEEWDDHAVNGVMIFCGGFDDESGWFWSERLQTWVSYMF